MIGWFNKGKASAPTTPDTDPAQLVCDGLDAQRSGQIGRARQAYEQALAIDPCNADGHYLLATLALGEGSVTDAIQGIGRAIQVNDSVAAYHFTLAVALRSSGDLRGAIESFTTASTLDGDDTEVLHELSVTLEAAGELNAAADTCLRLTQLDGNAISHHFRLGSLRLTLDQPDAAEASFRRVLVLDPTLSAARVNLGNALLGMRRPKEAIALFRDVLSSEPDNESALINLSTALLQTNDQLEAEQQLRYAVSIHRESGAAFRMLGTLSRDRGMLRDAEAAFREVWRIEPNSVGALLDLADLLTRSGIYAEAETLLRTAIKRGTTNANVHLGLAQICVRTHRETEAENFYNTALERDPISIGAHVGLANLYYDQARAEECEVCARKALALDARSVGANVVLGLALMLQGKPLQAENQFRAAIDTDPTNEGAWSQLLLCLNYNGKHDRETIANAHFGFGERIKYAISKYPPFTRPDRAGNRKIRIGYISPDFYDHVVSFFLEPVLRNHDHSRFEVFCYHTGLRFDGTTSRLQSLADHWRHIPAVTSDAALANIRADQLDIAIDLAGHTFGDQLRIFAARVAPVQMTWLGYPNTTGISMMDWRITDANADPENTEVLHSEKLLRLPGSFLTVREPKHAPAIVTPPSSTRGYVTFGSFNNHIKISDDMLQLWARVLAETPESQLMIKAMALKHPHMQEEFRRRAQLAGIEPGRLKIQGPVASAAEHLALYNQIDIALDTFPYNGTTTTTDALWMSVPTVVLAGDRHAARVGASLMATVGADALIAQSPNQYVEIATRLARNSDEQSMWRACLRERMSRSSLGDNAQFTRNFEDAIARTLSTNFDHHRDDGHDPQHDATASSVFRGTGMEKTVC